MLRRTCTGIVALFLLAGCRPSAPPVAPGVGEYAGTRDAGGVPLYSSLGDHHHPITTAAATAQSYFDQGLRLTYGFNHAEAIRSFRAAQRLDPECAMCYWGEALAFGPNINAPMDSASGVAAYRAVRRALELAPAATEKEQAYIRALAERYGPDPLADRARRDSVYARAMGELTRRFPEDDDAAALHAEAQMDLSPWDYWTEDRQPKPNGREALASLERVLARSPNHAGACHFFIHAVEAAYPERAVPCAERLPSLMPGAGHIVHMPAHIYIRVGRYSDAIERNVHAVHADEQILDDLAPDGVYRLGYYPHNYHFLWFAATMAGRGDLAVEAARNTASKVNSGMLRVPELAALQHYLATPLFALVRFGRWDEILREPAPPSDLSYPMGVWNYARAMALIGKGRSAEAEIELARLRERRADPALEPLAVWGLNRVTTLLDIAIAAVEAELAARRGEHDQALEHLRRGLALEDGLTYDEPPTWHLPLRHQLGAILLEAGRPGEAEVAYRRDLERHPENGWALFGLAESLRRQGRVAEAAQVEERFRRSWEGADVTLTASRF